MQHKQLFSEDNDKSLKSTFWQQLIGEFVDLKMASLLLNQQKLSESIESIQSNIDKRICVETFNSQIEYTKKRIDEILQKNDLMDTKLELIESTLNTVIKQVERCQGKLSVNDIRMEDDDKTVIAISKKTDYLQELINTIQSNIGHISDEISDINFKCDQNSEVFEEIGLVHNNISQFNMLDKRTNSQAGEDSIIAYIIAVLGIPFKECSYIDLGANHPKEMSNTYFFYSQGARGVLVEANPALIPKLKFYRNEDIILNKCIDSQSGILKEFNVLNIDGLSSSDKNSTDEVILKNKNSKVVDVVTVETITVNEILESYFSTAPIILSIDVEGKEMDVLNSIDWDIYRPLIIVIEMIPYSTTLTVGIKNEEIIKFMMQHDYIEFAFTGINSIFIDEKKLMDLNIL